MTNANDVRASSGWAIDPEAAAQPGEGWVVERLNTTQAMTNVGLYNDGSGQAPEPPEQP